MDKKEKRKKRKTLDSVTTCLGLETARTTHMLLRRPDVSVRNYRHGEMKPQLGKRKRERERERERDGDGDGAGAGTPRGTGRERGSERARALFVRRGATHCKPTM